MNTKIIIVGIVVVVLVIVGISVWGPKNNSVAPTPTPTAEASASITPSESVSPTPAGSPTPTPKVTTQILKTGKGTPVKESDIVAVLYTGKLTNGTVFDASSKHDNQPITFLLGSGQVIPGFEQGIVGMKLGEKRRITIPAALAYGEVGVPQAGIPANATLIFDVELTAINPPSPTPSPAGSGSPASSPSITPTKTP